MRALCAEIAENEAGRIDREVIPLQLLPHKMEDLVRDLDWPDTRAQGCFPPGALRVDTYWSPVNRADNAWRDRHLVCTCPPMEGYAEGVE